MSKVDTIGTVCAPLIDLYITRMKINPKKNPKTNTDKKKKEKDDKERENERKKLEIDERDAMELENKRKERSTCCNSKLE